MNLYEIAAEYRADLEKISDLDLPSEVVLDTIESIAAPLQDKVRSVVAYAKNLRAIAEAKKKAAKDMAERAKALENRAESLDVYVQANLQASGLALPLRFPEFDVNIAKLPPSVDVVDVDRIPSELLRREVTVNLEQAEDVTVDFSNANKDRVNITITAVPKEGVKWINEPKKKEIIDRLKAGSDIPGARLNPVGYRLSVR